MALPSATLNNNPEMMDENTNNSFKTSLMIHFFHLTVFLKCQAFGGDPELFFVFERLGFNNQWTTYGWLFGLVTQVFMINFQKAVHLRKFSHTLYMVIWHNLLLAVQAVLMFHFLYKFLRLNEYANCKDMFVRFCENCSFFFLGEDMKQLIFKIDDYTAGWAIFISMLVMVLWNVMMSLLIARIQKDLKEKSETEKDLLNDV